MRAIEIPECTVAGMARSYDSNDLENGASPCKSNPYSRRCAATS